MGKIGVTREIEFSVFLKRYNCWVRKAHLNRGVRMGPTLKMSACRKIGGVAALAAGLIINPLAIATAFASDAMPVEQQNALVQKYCAVCHTDAVRNGGLS